VSGLAFIGFRPCGCVTFVMVANRDVEPEDVDELQRVVDSGRRIQLVPLADAKRRLTFECAHEQARA
jgi:hypothetical protein